MGCSCRLISSGAGCRELTIGVRDSYGGRSFTRQPALAYVRAGHDAAKFKAPLASYLEARQANINQHWELSPALPICRLGQELVYTWETAHGRARFDNTDEMKQLFLVIGLHRRWRLPIDADRCVQKLHSIGLTSSKDLKAAAKMHPPHDVNSRLVAAGFPMFRKETIALLQGRPPSPSAVENVLSVLIAARDSRASAQRLHGNGKPTEEERTTEGREADLRRERQSQAAAERAKEQTAAGRQQTEDKAVRAQQGLAAQMGMDAQKLKAIEARRAAREKASHLKASQQRHLAEVAARRAKAVRSHQARWASMAGPKPEPMPAQPVDAGKPTMAQVRAKAGWATNAVDVQRGQRVRAAKQAGSEQSAAELKARLAAREEAVQAQLSKQREHVRQAETERASKLRARQEMAKETKAGQQRAVADARKTAAELAVADAEARAVAAAAAAASAEGLKRARQQALTQVQQHQPHRL